MYTHKVLAVTGVIAILVAIAGFGLWYQFFRDDPPPPVSLISAVESIDSTATTSEDTTVEDAAATETLDGSWVVTTTADSFVGYRIGEELASIGTTEAVGRTASVEGSITIDSGTLTAATLTADMTSLESDESRRDQALERQSLETGT